MSKVKIKKSDIENSSIKTVKSKNFFQKIRTWADSKYVIPFNIGSSCCAVDYASKVVPSNEDLIVDPSKSDLLIISGPVNYNQLELLKETYNQMLEPKWVMAYGACASSNGPYRSYNLVENIEDHIKIDVKVFGCPPIPKALEDGFKELERIILES